jgi:hypothetical protein
MSLRVKVRPASNLIPKVSKYPSLTKLVAVIASPASSGTSLLDNRSEPNPYVVSALSAAAGTRISAAVQHASATQAARAASDL